MNLFNSTLQVWAMHREFRSVLAELSNRSDRELADLGLGRADLIRVAYEEAERRILTPAPDSRSHREPSLSAWQTQAAPAGR